MENYKRQKTSSPSTLLRAVSPSNCKKATNRKENLKLGWSFVRFLHLELFWSLFFVLWSLPSFAQAPASAPADQTTPQGTVVLLARATQAGDADALARLFHATDAQQKSYVQALTQQAHALAMYRQAVIKAFGQDVADRIAGNAIDEENLRNSKTKIDGEKASVTLPGGEPYELLRVGGIWKVSAAQLTAGKNAQIMQQELTQMKQLSGVLVEVSEELVSGKYTTPEQLDDAIRAKRLRAMSSAPPATAPSR
jgi:hypothetical protein